MSGFNSVFLGLSDGRLGVGVSFHPYHGYFSIEICVLTLLIKMSFLTLKVKIIGDLWVKFKMQKG